ncbi:MAG: DNA replication/repair protein RecF [Polymorphobacter sp.]
MRGRRNSSRTRLVTIAPSIRRLRLTQFRSYADAVVDAAPGLVIITGENGQGKTNLLDAVSLLAPGRGLRGAALSDAARTDGTGGWTVAATLIARGGPVDIGTGTLASAPDRRQLRINGATAPVAQLGEWLSILWLTPAMDRLFSEPASGRRRFLDRLVLALHPGHGREAARYDAAMRARTRLLADPAPDPVWLAALERAMAEHGAAVASARNDTVAALADALLAAPESPFARAEIAMGGWDTPADAAGDFAADLARNRNVDAAAGRATAGPHRADFTVSHAAKRQPAARSSTGEQKALLLGIILAHAELVAARTGAPPLLLLDEIAAHLDVRRRSALFDRLAATGTQVWMTGTEAALFADAPAATRLLIADGAVRQN